MVEIKSKINQNKRFFMRNPNIGSVTEVREIEECVVILERTNQ